VAFDWGDYLVLARELSERKDEASLRSAISRAYYAVFGSARARIEPDDASPIAAPDDHRAVWRSYQDSDEDIRYYIGLDGNRLRRARNAADYDPVFADLDMRARRAVEDAEIILSNLRRL
jgi:uncharacterized protein (UPF0332 family)